MANLMEGVRKEKTVRLLTWANGPMYMLLSAPFVQSHPKCLCGKDVNLTLYIKPEMSTGHEMAIPGDDWVWGV